MTKQTVTDIQKHIGTNPMRLMFLLSDQSATPENPNINLGSKFLSPPYFELKWLVEMNIIINFKIDIQTNYHLYPVSNSN